MVARVRKLAPVIACLALLAIVAASGYVRAQDRGLDPVQELGQLLYLDEGLSEPAGQSCASCHDPDAGLPVSKGTTPAAFGARNAPGVAYAMYSPIFDRNDEGRWAGGLFWDGRATGESLRDPLAEQARGPFLNQAGMANPDKAAVIAKVAARYAEEFAAAWPDGDLTDTEDAYDKVALAIAAFERTARFAPFSSKYDAYLRTCLDKGGDPDDCALGSGDVAKQAGQKVFSPQEWRGLQLFVGGNDNDGILGPGEGAKCAACHSARWTDPPRHLAVVIPSWSPDGRVPPLFTGFTYDNLGMPRNSAVPHDPDAPPDIGLGVIAGDGEEHGKFRVMTLRDIALTAPYAHNGTFQTLKEIVHFCSTRDVPGALPNGADWPAPEVLDTVNHDQLGNLGLSDSDEDALVAFMAILSDGHRP